MTDQDHCREEETDQEPFKLK